MLGLMAASCKASPAPRRRGPWLRPLEAALRRAVADLHALKARWTLAYFLTVAEVAPQMVPFALSTTRHSRVAA
jgi:hypothetical protein